MTAFGEPSCLFYSLMADSASSDAGSGVTNSWCTGTGYASAGQQNASGNSDLYVGPDALHPTALAAEYMGRRYANAFKSLVASLSV